MLKTNVVEAVAKATGLTKKAAQEAVEAMLKAVTDALKRGDKVTLTGFGNFVVRQRKARKGRNIQTGAVINIPATKVPAFKAGKALKAAVK